MIPRVISTKLASLRGRERLLALAWGVARWLAIVLILLVIAAFIDWLIDREEETPWAVRYSLFVLQIAAAALLAGCLVIRPLGKRLGDAELALRVEDRYPELGHRLISAVQLNAPAADTEGMSPELIGEVTRQAERQAQPLHFAGVADHCRLKWSMLVALPALLFFSVPFLIWPEVSLTLLARQFLADRDIPRSVVIESLTAEVWPKGESVPLRFRVQGADVDAESAGQVTVRPFGQAKETYPLELEAFEEDGQAIFIARLPASSSDFTYSARLGDGRLRRPGQVRFVPRPVITDIVAWVVLPRFCGLDADGNRYEQPQPRGDIVGIPGSAARVRVYTQRPIAAAVLKVWGPKEWDASRSSEEGAAEIERRSIALEVHIGAMTTADGEETTLYFADGMFDLRPDETSYVVEVVDEYGFENRPPPRRKIRLVEEEKPQVTLLKEQFPPSSRIFSGDLGEDYEVEGMPVPLGKDIRIAYVAQGPYGLGQARLLYRVVRKVESGNDEPGVNPWIALPLQEVLATPEAGPFNPRIGAFRNSGLREQVFFHAGQAPGSVLPRTLGGGRFDFKTTGIPDSKGDLLKLKIGDQIEYCIEVFADKDLKGGRPSNRSETRVKTIVSESDFVLWVTDTIQEERRIRQLDAKQRGLFEDR